MTLLLERYGCLVTATDIDQASVEYARRRVAAKVHAVDANHVDTLGPSGTYDVVLFGDSLEHLEEPRYQVELAHRALRRGGRIVVSVPNKWAPANLTWRVRHAAKRYTREHLHEFSRLDMGVLLGARFDDVRFRYCNVIPHWWGLPLASMRAAERLVDHPLGERLGWTMIAVGTK